MNAVELAERKSRAWAIMLYVLAGLLLLAELIGMTMMRSDFIDGFWLGMAMACALTLTPWRRWFRSREPISRLLDDEGVRDHRRTSCNAGFWAGLAAALLTAPLAHDTIIGGYDVARVVATASLFAAMVSFATLELRAIR